MGTVIMFKPRLGQQQYKTEQKLSVIWRSCIAIAQRKI